MLVVELVIHKIEVWIKLVLALLEGVHLMLKCSQLSIQIITMLVEPNTEVHIVLHSSRQIVKTVVVRLLEERLLHLVPSIALLLWRLPLLLCQLETC